MSEPTTTPIASPAEVAAIMALAMPLIQTFAAELVKLPPEEQTQRIAKMLAAMRGDVP